MRIWLLENDEQLTVPGAGRTQSLVMFDPPQRELAVVRKIKATFQMDAMPSFGVSMDIRSAF